MTYTTDAPAKEETKCGEFNQEYVRQRMEGTPIDRSHIIITEPMIIDCLNESLPGGDEGKYARMVKLDIKTVTFLKMEYRSISEIANMNSLVNLTKLQLCNNVIKRIQNLDHLIHLSWLDLSYNSIRKIEGLDKLTKLEVLNLHQNFIRTLEGLDNNLRLEMFHISTNKLDNLENTRYLRRLVRLRSVSLQGNPVSMDPEFIYYFIAYVPQVELLDYIFIPKVEREVAAARHKLQVDKWAAAEDKLIRRASVVEAEEEVKQLHKLAFVDGLLEDEFWELLYETDTEGQVLLQLGDTEDIQYMFMELFRRATKDIFEKGMKAYEQRQNEIDAYNTAIAEEIELVQTPANKMTEEFVEYAGQVLKDVKILVSLIEDHERRVQNGLAHELPPEFPEFQNNLNILLKDYVKRLHDIWFTLINQEMDFNESMEEVNDNLDRSIRDIVTNWLEQLRGQSGQLRDIEQQLNGRLLETLVTYGEFRLSDTNIPENLHHLVSDKDALANCIQMSHDHHVSVIDGKEDQICQKMKGWQDSFSIGLTVNEYERNKARLNEISHFVDTYYMYLEETRALSHATVHIPTVRSDQECEDPKTCEPLLWYERLKKRLLVREKKFKQSYGTPEKAGEKRKSATGVGAAKSTKSKLAAAVPTRTSFIL